MDIWSISWIDNSLFTTDLVIFKPDNDRKSYALSLFYYHVVGLMYITEPKAPKNQMKPL